MTSVSTNRAADSKVQARTKLGELLLNVAPLPAAERIWTRVYSEAQRNQLGKSFLDAFERRGTIDMWRHIFGVSCVRAVIDASSAINLLSPEDRRWLLREVGEADDYGVTQTAIKSRALVLTEKRLAWFDGKPVEIEWESHSKLWHFLWELARASKRGRNLDHFDLGENASSKTVTDRKNRLKDLLPPKLFRLILRIRGAGCRIDLPPDMIRLFVLDSSDMLVEWTGWEPATSG